MVIEGPLAPWATGIAGQLKRLGYAPSTAAQRVPLVGRLSRFLQQQGLAASELSTEVVGDSLRPYMQTRDSLGRPPGGLVRVAGRVP